MQQNHVTSAMPLSAVDRVIRDLVRRKLATLREGHLRIVDHEREQSYGDPLAPLNSTITVLNPRFYSRVVLGGGLGAAESLIDGDWRCSDLTQLVRIFIRNMHVSDGLDRGLAAARRLMAWVGHRLRKNTTAGAKRNIHAHYDLSNDFYSLFLDSTMTYSSGIFDSPDTTLREASIAKLDCICRKLDLRPTDHLLEIGAGWGSLAIHAAKNFGCRVTTTTISDEQFSYARDIVKRNRLEDRVSVLCRDYRELTGTYDKLVSVEMIEAVGPEFYEAFFAKCRELLRPEGMAFLQSIVIADERYKQHLHSVDFIRRYIYPGGCLPSNSTLTNAAAVAGGMRVLHLEDIAPHYVETLRRWRERFRENIKGVRALGFDDRFIRMWEYYLSYCEAAFEERQVNNVQMLLGMRECRRFALDRLAVGPKSVNHRLRGQVFHGADAPLHWLSRRGRRSGAFTGEATR